MQLSELQSGHVVRGAQVDATAHRERRRQRRLLKVAIALGVPLAWFWYRWFTGDPVHPGLPAIVRNSPELSLLVVLLVLIGSANRDPSVFPNPDTLDIRRANAKEHIAFGYGAHICIGAPLARLEIKVVLEEVSKRLPSLRLTQGQHLRYLPNTSFRGPRGLRVEWDE